MTTKVSPAMGGGWEYISVVNASGASTIAFTNMVSGYDYHYVLENIVPSVDSRSFHGELGISGPTYRTANYKATAFSTNVSGTSQSAEATTNMLFADPAVTEGLGTGTNEKLYRAELTLTNPAGTSEFTSWIGHAALFGHNAEMVPMTWRGVYTGAAEAHVAIKWYAQTGNLTGDVYQYRRLRGS